MSDNLTSIVFVLVTALVCSLLLTGFSTGLMVPKQRNIQTDRQKNILEAVGLLTREQTADWQAIERLYAEHIRCGRVDRNGQVMPDTAASEGLLPVCFQVRDGQVAAYILPVETKGLWGTIKGYLAIENDGATVTGFTVYSHQETPGLGGEIEKAWFQHNFKGKTDRGPRRRPGAPVHRPGPGRQKCPAGTAAQRGRRDQRRQPDRSVPKHRV